MKKDGKSVVILGTGWLGQHLSKMQCGSAVFHQVLEQQIGIILLY